MRLRPHNGMYVVYEDDVKDTPAGGGGEPSAPKTPSSDVDWTAESDLRDEDNVDATPDAPVAPSTPAAPAPSAPATPAPSTSAPSAPAAPAAPVPAPTATTPVAPAPATPAPAAPVALVAPEPAPVAAPAPAAPDLAALRSAEVTRLTGVYASRLTEDVARGLLVEPEKHLPAILANLQVDTIDTVVQHMYSTLPQLIQNMTKQSSAAQEAEVAFYKAWPTLNDASKPEYKTVVENAIRTYRTLNPRAPREEIIRAAGLQAMITLRLPLPAELFAPQPPVAPPTPAPSFAHAAPSASAPAPATPGTGNAFTLLNEEYDRDERA